MEWETQSHLVLKSNYSACGKVGECWALACLLHLHESAFSVLCQSKHPVLF